MMLSWLRSPGHHRCVTPLYVIPMWIFDDVLLINIAVIRNCLTFMAWSCRY